MTHHHTHDTSLQYNKHHHIIAIQQTSPHHCNTTNTTQKHHTGGPAGDFIAVTGQGFLRLYKALTGQTTGAAAAGHHAAPHMLFTAGAGAGNGGNGGGGGNGVDVTALKAVGCVLPQSVTDSVTAHAWLGASTQLVCVSWEKEHGVGGVGGVSGGGGVGGYTQACTIHNHVHTLSTPFSHNNIPTNNIQLQNHTQKGCRHTAWCPMVVRPGHH